MNSLWNDQEALRFQGPLGERVYTSRLLGRDPSLVLHGGGNTSVKVIEPNVFGESEDVLYVKGRGADLSTIDANPFLSGNQAFQFIGTNPFSAPGQVNVFNDAGNTVIQLNTDFDLYDAESQIQANDGPTNASYWAAIDFIL